MSEQPANHNLANFLDDVVNEVNEDIRTDEEEFEQFIDSLSDQSDKYASKEFIAEGGMKNIYRVQEKHTLRKVAMAQLKNSEHSKKKILSFLKEARITALLEHPNIVPVHEINQKDGLPYFTMKEIQGQTLGYILRKLKDKSYKFRKLYDLNNLLNIFIKVCDAIAYAHSKNIVHLDLKPDNIHVGEFGEVLVIDWGLAKNLDDKIDSVEYLPEELDLKPQATMDGMIKGTIGYMAPEQARGENSEKDKLTDIYSLGAILYTILALEPPYKNDDLVVAIGQISKGKYTKITESSNIPKALISVSERAMEKHKNDRYQSVEELQDDVQLFLSGFATKAQEASLSQLIVLFYKRNKTLCSVAASFLLALVIITTFFIISLKESENKANINARLAVKNAEEASKKEAEARRLFDDLSRTIKAKDELTHTSIPLILKRFDFLRREMEFDQSFLILDEVHSDSIKDVRYWLESAYYKLGIIQPKEALVYLEKANAIASSDEIKRAIAICKKYSPFTNDYQMAQQYLKDLFALQQPFLTGHYCQHIHREWQDNKNQKIPFIKNALKIVNPQEPSLKISIEYLSNSSSYNIKLDNNQKLWDISPLAGLAINKLSMVGCKGLKSLIFLKSTGIKILNLSETDGNKLKFRQNVYNVWIDSLEELTMRNMDLKYLRLGGRPNYQLFDFAGSSVNLINITNQNVKDLNLCSAKLESLDSLKRYSQLKRLVIPNKYFSKSMVKSFQNRNVKLFRCQCSEGVSKCNYLK